MQFKYRALARNGERHRGVTEASSAVAARQKLREQGLTATSLVALGEAGTGTGWMPGGRPGDKDVVLMTRQLATLTAAALPLEQCLAALEAQAEKQVVRQMLATLRQKIKEGESLAGALSGFPGSFSSVYCATVAAGEASGRLDRVLEELADYTERVQAMKRRITQALVYPCMLTVIAFSVITILMTAVVPEVAGQFMHMDQQLPLTTRVLLMISDGLVLWGPWAGLCLVLAGLVARVALRKDDTRLRWDRQKLFLPVFGKTVRYLSMARYARTLSILTHSAVPLTEGMRISASVLDNRWARQQMNMAYERVREGSGLSDALAQTGLLPPMMRYMIASGENSGALDHMLARAADMQENTFSAQITVALTLFEPLLVSSMAGIVLFIILAILQPILQLNSLIG